MTTLRIPFGKSIGTALALATAVAIPAVVTTAPATAQSRAGQSSAGDLDRAVQALRGISTMKANFTQTDRQGRTIGGELTLKRPGKIRFEYDKSANMLVVSNGSSLYLVDYEVNQVQRWPISNSPLGALLDPNRDVKQYGKLVQTSHPGVVSVEVRDPKRPEFGMITLIFTRDSSAPGGLQLTNWVALDSQNNRTTVRLSNQRYGVSVADSAFTFRDPRRSSRRPG